MIDISCDAATAVTLPADDSFYESRIEFPQDCDWFRVQLQGGKVYAFTYVMGARDDDAIVTLKLRAGGGEEISYLASFYHTTLLGYSYRAPTTGTYYLDMSGAAAADYSLSVGRDCGFHKPVSCAITAPGQFRTGKIQHGWDSDAYKVMLEAGVTYAFEVASTAPQAFGDVSLRGKRVSVEAVDAIPPAGFASAKRIAAFEAPHTGPYFFGFGPPSDILDARVPYKVSYRLAAP